jgi:ribosomal protein S18 acetylase RimI-like enzyme
MAKAKPIGEAPPAQVSCDAVREVAVPGGMVRLRPALPADEPFQFDLFRDHNIRMLQPGGLPQAMLDSLATMQYRARVQSYRDSFPGARWSIIELADVPAGELIENDETNAIYIVDITLRPEQRRHGIGSALVRSVIAAGTERGGVRALVLVNNQASLGLFRRLGFVETGRDGGHVELRWRPSAGAE